MGDNVVTPLDWSYWLRCPCGSSSWLVKVDKPAFTRFISLVCENCGDEAPVNFKMKGEEDGEENNE